MPGPLDPAPLSRLGAILRPDWLRTPTARRIAAGALVVLAAIAALRADPQRDHVDVVVAARDLMPGTRLGAADVELRRLPASAAPDGSQYDPATVSGAMLAGPARRGEVLTDVRLLGPRLAETTAGPDARLVPLRLADPALLDLIRPGDVVDVLAGESTVIGSETAGSGSRVLATRAIVVLVSNPPDTRNADRVVLVALPAGAANEVAGAALTQAITLTFR